MPRESEDQKGAVPLWQPCPPGEFERLSERLRRRRQRRRFLRVSLAAAAALAGVGGGGAAYLALTRQSSSVPTQDMDFAGIKCSQVRQVAAAYLRGDLDEETRRRVTAHVAQCPNCNRLLNDMRSAS